MISEQQQVSGQSLQQRNQISSCLPTSCPCDIDIVDMPPSSHSMNRRLRNPGSC